MNKPGWPEKRGFYKKKSVREVRISVLQVLHIGFSSSKIDTTPKPMDEWCSGQRFRSRCSNGQKLDSRRIGETVWPDWFSLHSEAAPQLYTGGSIWSHHSHSKSQGINVPFFIVLTCHLLVFTYAFTTSISSAVVQFMGAIFFCSFCVLSGKALSASL